MNLKPQVSYITVVAVVAAMILSVTAWNQSAAPNQKVLEDTVPTKKEKKIRNLDEVIEEIDRSALQLEKEMSGERMEKMEKEIQASLKELNSEKFKEDMDKALKEVDIAKIKAEVDRSLNSIDMKEMQKNLEVAMKELKDVNIDVEMKAALKEVNAEKIKAEVDASIAKIDMEKMRKEMERVKEIDIPKIEMELKNLRPEIEKSMKEAKISIEKAKAEMTEYKGFVDGLDKDGLINKNEKYSIEHEDGTLKINGKDAGADVYKKYSNFLNKHKNFTIKKDGDDFNIDID